MSKQQPKTTRSGGSSPAHTPAEPTLAEVLGAIKSFRDEIKQEMKQVKEEFNQVKDEINQIKVQGEEQAQDTKVQMKEIRQDIIAAFEGLAGSIENLNHKTAYLVQSDQITKQRMDKMDFNAQKVDVDITMIQYRSMEFAIRIRGVKEDKQEDLKERMAAVLAPVIGSDVSPREVEGQIDKIYRVNSLVAKQKKLPRDIVIYFSTRNVRNKILEITFKQKLKVDGYEVNTMKEIPPKMLRSRREFAFLVDELKKRGLQYRWEIPFGVSLIYMGTRYRLNTVPKARQFYHDVLLEKQQSSEVRKETVREEEMLLTSFSDDGSPPKIEQIALTGQEDLLAIESPKEPRQTRAVTAAAKRKERQQREAEDPTQYISQWMQSVQYQPQQMKEKEQMQQQQQSAPIQKILYSEAVGGARPKMSQEHQELLQKLQRPKDGR